jgi:hypothetical protein
VPADVGGEEHPTPDRAQDVDRPFLEPAEHPRVPAAAVGHPLEELRLVAAVVEHGDVVPEARDEPEEGVPRG